MKKLLLFGAFLLGCFSGQAQDTGSADALNDINAIKRDTSFIYAESTMKDALEAQSGAQAILELKLYDWLRSNYPNENAEALVNNSKEKWFPLLTKRGKYNRIFVYVKKRDVVPIAEEPEPVEEEFVPILEEVLVPELTSDEESMAAIVRFDDIEPYVKGLKNDGRIRAYGKYASLPEDDPCYMFVYDKEGSVVAVLRQSEDGQHFNLRSLKEDNVRNYKNCGAIWLQFK
ncbi:MAG: hypothetical protein IKY01_03530 [Prevotella sp.]|nr:hypothetical protein [Prevotella sp.]